MKKYRIMLDTSLTHRNKNAELVEGEYAETTLCDNITTKKEALAKFNTILQDYKNQIRCDSFNEEYDFVEFIERVSIDTLVYEKHILTIQSYSTDNVLQEPIKGK